MHAYTHKWFICFQTLHQRHRDFAPSLRVETSFYSTLEARESMRADEKQKRVVDQIFKPFAKSKQVFHEGFGSLLELVDVIGRVHVQTSCVKPRF